MSPLVGTAAVAVEVIMEMGVNEVLSSASAAIYEVFIDSAPQKVVTGDSDNAPHRC